jgi:hypothetical protein
MNTRGRGRRRLQIAGAVGGSLAVAAALLAVTAPVQAINNAKNGPLDARGFPAYFTDDSGISLAICEDASANCLAATTADLADTTDGEAFYWMATASVPSARGTIDVEFALEAAFSAPNVPMVFERLRVRGDRVLLKGTGWRAASIELLGTTPISPALPRVFPSDHFGVACRLVEAE